MDKHAIVYGASGLVGWAVVDQLLRSGRSFSKVTAVTNRPLTLKESCWPASDSGPELQLVCGIDLRQADGETRAESLKEHIQSVTHVYYGVFAAVDDDIEEVAINKRMLQNVVDAHNLFSPGLQFVTFPGGTRGYGIYAPGGTFTPPLHEDMVHNLPPDYAATVVYPAYRDLLKTASHNKPWTWCEVCPDAIIGFTPHGSQFSLALHWAQYLSLYADNHGIRLDSHPTHGEDEVQVPFPGTSAAATSLFSPVASTTLARFMIHASLHPDTCGSGRLFNVADSEIPCTYGQIWPRLAGWFGLVGTVPDNENSLTKDGGNKAGEIPTTSNQMPSEYISEHRDVFTRCGRDKAVSAGVGWGSRQLDSVGYWLTFDRQMSLDRMRDTGFEGGDTVQGWLEAFEMFRKAGLIL